MEYARKNFGGVQGYGRPRRGSRGGAPRTPENFRKFVKNSLRKLQKCSILAYFAKRFQNPALNFRAFGRKIQLVAKILKIFDENSISKLKFYLFLGKFVAKNRNLGNNIIFLQQFFPLGGGGEGGLPPLAPCVRHGVIWITNENVKISLIFGKIFL